MKPHAPPHNLATHQGFTMVEMVVILLLVGVLSVTIIPKLDLASNLTDEYKYQELRAVLAYASDTAKFRRRTVCILLNQNGPGVALKIASTNPATSCDLDLRGPTGTNIFFDAAAIGLVEHSSPGSPESVYVHPDASQNGRVSYDLAGTVSSSPGVCFVITPSGIGIGDDKCLFMPAETAIMGESFANIWDYF